MFEFDLSKMVLFGAVALIVVGPKELPAALRTAGRVMTKIKSFRAEAFKAVDTLIADASLDGMGEPLRVNLALDFQTAMRGSLPVSGATVAQNEVKTEALEYASPEMRAYLSPPAESAPLEGAAACSRDLQIADPAPTAV